MQLRVERTRASRVDGTVPWNRPRHLPISLAETATRQLADYRCPRAHRFVVPLDADAIAPPTWRCRQHGVDGSYDGPAPTQPADASSVDRRKPVSRAKTSVEELLERRSIAELDALLDERLQQLHQQRGTQPREASPASGGRGSRALTAQKQRTVDGGEGPVRR